jgi:protein-tyrosine phosphatase
MAALGDIFWINGDPPPGLAVVLPPRGNDWLEDELRRMKNAGIRVIVSLLEAEEAAELGLSQESEMAVGMGLEYCSFAIPDRHVPPNRVQFRNFAQGLATRLRAGTRIGVHCRGSIGRASITAACTLIQLGWKAETALAAIESARGCPIPDTPEQRQWILNFEAGL